MLACCSHNCNLPHLSPINSPMFYILLLSTFVNSQEPYYLSRILLIPTNILIHHSFWLPNSTALRSNITPLHTSLVSPKVDSISNLVTDGTTRTRLLNTPSPHMHELIFKSLNEGSGASSETLTTLGQPYINSTWRHGNTASPAPLLLLVVHTSHHSIPVKLRISNEGNAGLFPRISKPTYNFYIFHALNIW